MLISTPCGAPTFLERGAAFAHAIGRLRLGASVEQAQADLDTINRELARSYPETNRNVTAGVQPFRNIVIGKYEKSLWLLLSAVGLVLLIACANVAHLQLARGLDRQIELAIRAANGADRPRLFRQLLTETLLLSSLAGAGATALASWGLAVVRSLSLTDIARLDTAGLDLRLAGVAAILSVVSALIAGAWPAWKAAGVRINDVLKLGGGSTGLSSRRNLRDLLVTTELALATVLLILAGLMIGSFVRLSRAQWGFDPDRLWLVNVMRPANVAASREGAVEWTEAARSRIARIKGVSTVASADGVPIDYVWRPTSIALQGRIVTSNWTAAGWTVSHGYFKTIGTPILQGREFTESDGIAGAAVVVVSRALAAKLWPGSTAVGQELQVLNLRTVNGDLAPDVAARMRRRDPSLTSDISAFELEPRRVVGVVEDIRAFGLDLVPSPAYYVDYRQYRTPFGNGRATHFVVRTNAEAATLAGDVKAIVAGPDLHGEVRNVRSMSEMVARSIGGRGSNRLMMLVATLFGGLALLLTATGIFGMMLHTVNQRLPELGVRIALGATRADVARLILEDGMRMLMTGVALGLTLTWAASRTLRSLLFELAATDMTVWALSVAVLVTAVLLACVVPAQRALRADVATLFRA